LGNRKARAPTEPAARPPSLGSASPRCGRPSGVRGSGSAALRQSLACQPLSFRWKVGDLRALRLAALAVLGSVLVPGPAVTTPALAGVHLLGHSAPLSQVLLSVCVYPASGDAHIPSRQDGTALDNDDRGPRTVGCGTGLLAAHAGVELSRRWGPSASPTQQHRLLSAGGPPLPTGSGAGWHVLDADVGEPGRNHSPGRCDHVGDTGGATSLTSGSRPEQPRPGGGGTWPSPAGTPPGSAE
jgi:hypothetical protein